MRHEQNEKRNAVKPDRAIKSFEMIVEIFELQLRSPSDKLTGLVRVDFRGADATRG